MPNDSAETNEAQTTQYNAHANLALNNLYIGIPRVSLTTKANAREI